MTACTRPMASSTLRVLVLLSALMLTLSARGARAADAPLRAQFATQFESVVEFPLVHIAVGGSGQCLHMGRTGAASADQTVDLITGAGTATYTLTGANGDTVVLSIEFATVFTPSGVIFGGTYTVTGGTGRFTGATGSGSASGAAVFTGPTGGVGSFAIDGTISR
jgi:hypothetical protein